jgi:hypothetical protein
MIAKKATFSWSMSICRSRSQYIEPLLVLPTLSRRLKSIAMPLLILRMKVVRQVIVPNPL